MARSLSPVPISGKVGNLQFSIRDGKNHIHQARDYSKRHRFRMTAPHCRGYRMNLQEFAAASMISRQIYKHMPRAGYSDPTLPGPILRPYSHNVLTAKIKACGAHKHKHAIHGKGGFWYATEFRTPDIALALRGLDLSRGQMHKNNIELTAFGPSHNPNELRIRGFERAASHIRTAACVRLECRIHIQQIAFNEREWDDKSGSWQKLPNLNPDGREASEPVYLTPSNWIPVEIIPGEGIRIPIPACDEGSKHLTAVFIEWREHRGFGRRIVKLHDHGIVRIAAVHAPLAAFQEAVHHEPAIQPQHLIPAKLAHLAPEPEWRTDPKAYLANALTQIRPWEYQPPKPTSITPKKQYPAIVPSPYGQVATCPSAHRYHREGAHPPLSPRRSQRRLRGLCPSNTPSMQSQHGPPPIPQKAIRPGFHHPQPTNPHPIRDLSNSASHQTQSNKPPKPSSNPKSPKGATEPCQGCSPWQHKA